jgi:hypothetical protein
MKKYLCVLGVIIFTMTTTGFCNDKIILSASGITVDSLISYYTSMAELNNSNPSATTGSNYGDMANYISQNRQTLVTRIAETSCYDNMGRASQIINSLYQNQNTAHAYGSLNFRASEPGYFDAATGHRYVKTGEDTYAEYSKKGRFLKTVPSDLPLLTKSRNIHPITQDNYIVYQKRQDGKMDCMALPGSQKHPEGWEADKALVSLN